MLCLQVLLYLSGRRHFQFALQCNVLMSLISGLAGTYRVLPAQRISNELFCDHSDYTVEKDMAPLGVLGQSTRLPGQRAVVLTHGDKATK